MSEIIGIGLNRPQAMHIAIEGPTENKGSAAEAAQSFGNFLKDALESVNAQEQNVHKLNDQYLIGQVDVTNLQIASAQAQLGLQLTSQVRNKVVEAYQEIMRMQM